MIGYYNCLPLLIDIFFSNPLTFHSKCDKIIQLIEKALLAQLDRVTGYEPVGQGFESLTARHTYY